MEGMSWILRRWQLLDHYRRCWASSDTSLGVSWASEHHQVSETSRIGQGDWDSAWFPWSFPTLHSWSPGQANLLWIPCPQSVAIRNGMSCLSKTWVLYFPYSDMSQRLLESKYFSCISRIHRPLWDNPSAENSSHSLYSQICNQPS